MLLLTVSVSGLFKWRQFEPKVALLTVCWYLRFSVCRDVEELLAERDFRSTTSPSEVAALTGLDDAWPVVGEPIGSRVEETEARINRKYRNSLRSL